MSKKKKHTDKQRDYEVGNKKPPKEHQWKPGESGNPAGPPKAKTQLHRYICIYLDMTDAELNKIVKTALTQAQRAAMKLVRALKSGKGIKSENFTRYLIDRDLGKPQENVKVTGDTPLTDAECDDIRKKLLKNAD
jgi:hypothetical protein